MISKHLLCVFASLSVIFKVSQAEVVSSDGELSGVQGKYRYFYDDSVPNACDSVAMIGVGTAMTVDDYDLVSNDIVTDKPIVNIIVDHRPRWFVKTSSKDYAKFVNAIAEQITNVVPICNAQPKNILVGGHSASGQAAAGALKMLNFKPTGFVGLDPFKMNPKSDAFDLPALFWGFVRTTCRVKVSQAAKGGYQASPDGTRVLYQVQNPRGSGITHCAFTDDGCTSVCPSNPTNEWLRVSVGESLSKFIKAISSGRFSHKSFEFSNDDIKTFVNEEVAIPVTTV